MATEERVRELRRNLQKKAIPFSNVFGTPEGQEVFAALKAEFAPTTLCSESSHLTVIRAAQRDVIEYIESLIKLREEDFE